MTTRESIIAKIIVTKTGDVPEWVYEYTDEEVIVNVFNQILSKDDIIDTHPNVVKFFKKIPDYKFIRYSAIYDSLAGNVRLNPRPVLSFGLCLFTTKHQWKTLLHAICMCEKYEFNYEELVRFAARLAVSNCDKYNKAAEKVKVLLQILRGIVAKNEWFHAIESIFFQNYNTDPLGYNAITMELFLKIMRDHRFSHKNRYGVCLDYITAGLPVLYTNFPQEIDIPILMSYLECIIKNDYHIELDPDIALILHKLEQSDTAHYELEMVKERIRVIASSLHCNNLKYIDPMDKDVSTSDMYMTLFADDRFSAIPITDFAVIRHQSEKVGRVPMTIQRRFIEDGGNVRTMLGTNTFETFMFADILRTQEYWEKLVRRISISDVQYMIYHSVDFVTCALEQRSFAHDITIKLAKAIFVYPVDNDIYKIVNKYGANIAMRDYRYHLVQKIIQSVYRHQLYTDVPESMLYLQPSVLELYTMLPMDNIPLECIKYIAPSLITTYVRQLISTDVDYIEFNLGNGSLLSFIDPDINYPLSDFIIKDIIYKHERYAYICDIKEIDPIRFIDDIVISKNNREE